MTILTTNKTPSSNLHRNASFLEKKLLPANVLDLPFACKTSFLHFPLRFYRFFLFPHPEGHGKRNHSKPLHCPRLFGLGSSTFILRCVDIMNDSLCNVFHKLITFGHILCLPIAPAKRRGFCYLYCVQKGSSINIFFATKSMKNRRMHSLMPKVSIHSVYGIRVYFKKERVFSCISCWPHRWHC